MAIGDDIAEVFAEVGNPCEVTKKDGTVFNSYFDIEAHPFHSTTFVRQNCYNAVFPYDDDIEGGDAVLYNGINTLVMNLKPEFFQGDVVVKNAYLIHCSTSSGVIYRPQTNRTDYRASSDWGFAAIENIAALHFASAMDTSDEMVEDVFSLEKEVHKLFMSAHHDIRVGDRWMQTPSSKPFQILTITDRKYEGLHVCKIIEDERG